MRVLTLALAALLLTPASAFAQDDRYLLLAASRTATLQSEIDEAAGTGFRVVAASRADDSELLVLLERSEHTYSYRLLATTRTGTLQREIEEAAAAGYRIVPRTVTTKRTVGSLFADSNDEGELIVIMERSAEDVAPVQYLVLATSRTGTLQREMSDAVAGGFALVALASRDEHVAIFQRAR